MLQVEPSQKNSCLFKLLALDQDWQYLLWSFTLTVQNPLDFYLKLKFSKGFFDIF